MGEHLAAVHERHRQVQVHVVHEEVLHRDQELEPERVQHPDLGYRVLDLLRPDHVPLLHHLDGERAVVAGDAPREHHPPERAGPEGPQDAEVAGARVRAEVGAPPRLELPARPPQGVLEVGAVLQQLLVVHVRF